jgi:thiol:disulfide interchange protein DsbC
MLRYAVVVLFICLLPQGVWSFGGEGCGAGECADCHSLTTDEAFKLLPPVADQVDSVKFSEVGGLWEVQGQAKGRMFTAYIDFSKKYLIAGNVLRLRDGAQIGRTLDVQELRTEGAFLIGSANAPVKVFVFTDVKCSHCQKLHPELAKVVEQNPQVAFYVKLLPLFSDKKTVNNIVCSASNKVLDDAMAGKPVAENDCTSPAVDESAAFAQKWNIRSTPTLVLPNGQILPGGRSAETLLKELSPFMPAVVTEDVQTEKK